MTTGPLFFHPLWARHRRKVRWAFIAVVAYTVLGFLVFPPLAKWVATRQLSALLDRPVTIESLRLNPYVFSATIRGFRIQDKDGEALMSWEEVYVNLQPTSVFSSAWTVKELRTSQPYVRLQVNRDYSLNISDLITKFSQGTAPAETPPPTAASGLPPIRIDLLEIAGARVSVADLTTRTPFRRVLGPVQITLNHFRTHPDNKNPYAFTGTTDSGERFSWSGHFYLDPIRSDGELVLENLVLSKYAPIYQDLVKVDLEEGVVDVRARYRLEKSATTNYAAVTDASVGLRSLRVTDRATGEPVAGLREFRLTGAKLDALARRAEVAAIAVNGAALQLRRAKDASINVLQLAQPAETATNVSGGVQFLLQSVTNAFAFLRQTTNHWEATLRQLTVQDASVHLVDQVNSRPVELLVDRINVAVRNVSNVPGTNLAAEVSLRWNTNGSVRTDLSATLDPPAADIGVQLSQVELRALDPYLEPFVDVLILRSRLGLDARVQLRQNGTNPLPAVTVRGDLSLEDLGAAEPRTGQDLIRWRALRFSGLEGQLEPMTFAARELSVDDLFAHVIVETNGQINLLAAARIPAAPAAPVAGTGSETGNKGGGGGVKPGHGGRKGGLGVAIPTNAVPLDLPLSIAVGAVTFTNGAIRFTDRSARPEADASIQKLTGVVRGVSTAPGTAAELDVRGMVENTGAVRVGGRLYPMALARDSRFEVSLSGVDLLPTSPYVGRFLGHRLTKGRLGVDVRYEVRDGRVHGTNLIRLDQFTLGEKVNSPDALALPVKLGIAILKDRHGRIELDVPVEGSLSDPEFRLGRVITRTLVNILTRIVTSPFAALGAAFGGGGEELSYQEFAPGTDDLTPAARAKLDKIVTGLFERPGLQVEIEGAVDAVADGVALRRRKLEAAYRLAKWQSLGKSARAQTSPDRLAVTAEEFARHLEKRYAIEFAPAAVAARAAAAGRTNATASTPASAPGSRPSANPPAARPAQASVATARPPAAGDNMAKGAVALRGEVRERAPKVEAQTMAEQVIGLVPLEEADFAQLAARRARQVRDYLLQSGRVEPARILLSEPDGVLKASRGAKAFLKLE